MFLTNIHKDDKAYYEIAAVQCGVNVTFNKAQTDKSDHSDTTTYRDYISVHLPKWVFFGGIVAYSTTAESIKNGGNVDGPVLRLKATILKAFTTACNDLYDSFEELDPVEDKTWHTLFKQGYREPETAVKQYQNTTMEVVV